MSDGQDAGRAAFRRKSAEIGIAAVFFLFGALVMFDSHRLGSSWGDDGPRPGYFPFYVGLIICLSSLVNIVRGLAIPADKNSPFVLTSQLKLVLEVLIPTALYAAAVSWIGIYVASIVFIGYFMRWLGQYPWWKVVLVAFGTALVLYLIFEVWFLVPLPKGPVESLLGLD
ncbi:MAG TPA: tripartite tricarboxylate transporter TctB family protein [Burkholderiales bacterium]